MALFTGIVAEDLIGETLTFVAMRGASVGASGTTVVASKTAGGITFGWVYFEFDLAPMGEGPAVVAAFDDESVPVLAFPGITLNDSGQEMGAVLNGGGVLFGQVANPSTDFSETMDVVQGEVKLLTFILVAAGSFGTPTPAAITARFQDVAGETITVANGDITRVCQELDLQIIRVPLTAEQTGTLAAGTVKAEITVDGAKVPFTEAFNLIEGLV